MRGILGGTRYGFSVALSTARWLRVVLLEFFIGFDQMLYVLLYRQCWKVS